MRLTKLAIVVAAGLLLAGCGSGTATVTASTGERARVAGQSPTAPASSDGKLPSDATLQRYFDGVATQTAKSLAGALAAAEPGSPAAAYAGYLRASVQAATDGGARVDQAKATATRTDSGFRFCQGSGSGQLCYDYGHITGARGRVSSFSVNGKPIASRLIVGNDHEVQLSGLGAGATFVAAFESTSTGNLFVVVRVRAGASAGLTGVAGTYAAGGAGAAASTHSLGPGQLAPGSSGHYLFTFPGARIGGTVTLSASQPATKRHGTARLAIR